MACVIDHLLADHRVHVLQDFTDARGVRHRKGETAILRKMDLDWQRQEILLEWEREGAKESLFFTLAAKDGPRNGRMREYFSLGDRVAEPREVLERRKREKAVPIPEVSEEPVTDVACYSDAVSRVWALAARKRFAEAEAQIQLTVAAPDPHDARLERLAGDLVAIAVQHAEDEDAVVFEWARQKAVHLWYAWGSGATSGGEGAVRAESIRDAEERIARCEARRRSLGFV